MCSPYSLAQFQRALEAVFQSADSLASPDRSTPKLFPSLATILVYCMQNTEFLALDGDDASWRLTPEPYSGYEYRLVLPVPRLTRSMLLLLVEDGRELSQVVDLAALHEQMERELEDAYRKKFGV
jgi:hypothetical protein